MPSEESYVRSDLLRPGIGKQDRARSEFDIHLTQYSSMVSDFATLNLRLDAVLDKLVGASPTDTVPLKSGYATTEASNVIARLANCNTSLNDLRAELQGYIQRLEELV